MSGDRFSFSPIGELAGLYLAQRTAIEDDRGYLSRFFCAEAFAKAGLSISVVQINHTLTRKKGAVRGMHFQHIPHAEKKLVSCIKGEVWDVAVDLRRNSPTFLRWHGELLSASNRKSLLIPEGFAHGFQTLTEDCELIYLHTEAYHPASEDALNALDPALSINWPLDIVELSDRDRKHKFIEQNFQGIIL